jgi:hypothetical protein
MLTRLRSDAKHDAACLLLIIVDPLETAGTPILKPGPCTSRQNIRELPKDPPKDPQVEKIRWASAGSFGNLYGALVLR